MTSYNSTGFGIAAQSYIQTLLLFSDILCIQEHFLLDNKDKKHSNTNKLRNKFSNSYDMFIVPAYKENLQVSRGRGKGGLAMLWHKSLTKYVSRIKCNNYRLQATKFDLPSGALLVLNSYFPQDPRSSNFDDAEVLSLLTEIRSVIFESDCSNVLLCGDLNCHFPRQTEFTKLVNNYLDNMGLKIFWESSEENMKFEQIDYTHIHIVNQVAAYSTIDHFAGSQAVINCITEAGVVHDGSNHSNHSAIYTKLNVGVFNADKEKVKSEKRVDWSKATENAIENFKNDLASKLNLIEDA